MFNEQNFKELLIKKIKEVEIAKELRGYKTYEQCCNAFNEYYEYDISKGLFKELNKDFLFRVFSSTHEEIKFSLSNPRFVKLCEFLKVDMNATQASLQISEAALMVDELIRQKPELEKQIYSVIKSITNLSKGVIAHEIH